MTKDKQRRPSSRPIIIAGAIAALVVAGVIAYPIWQFLRVIGCMLLLALPQECQAL